MRLSQAALFTAICTAFVIESAKSLKEDTAETAARRLDQIASILLVVANANNTPPLNSMEIIAPVAPKPFSPRGVDVCVNALWFFSLSLSAAVALMAILAKEWCYQFMSGRIGDPWSQTERRQQRWSGIKKWKMEQVIIFLPSFIHLSFLSFAVGLCIYLGDLNWRVAILASIVTFGSIVVYVASTIFPFLNLSNTICPYSTSISRLVQRIKGRIRSAEHESEQTVRIAVEALVWLISSSEDSTSTDTALQAIAGADPDSADRQLLKKSGADKMVSWRLIGLDSYSKNYDQISDLYTRALSFFFQPQPTNSTEKPTPSSNDGGRRDSSLAYQKNLNRGLQKKIRTLRKTINKQITIYTSSDPLFLPTSDNIQALSIGSTAASHCLRSLGNGVQSQTQEQFHEAIGLLESYKNHQAHLNNTEINCLIRGVAMLLSCLLVDCPPAMGVDLVMRLLRITTRVGKGQKQLRLGCLGLPMIVYALSQHDYPGWIQPPQPSSIPRAERAIEVITYYVSNPLELDNVASLMVNLGLLELLSKQNEHELEVDDIVDISEAFDPMVDAPNETYIHTFPPNPYPYTFSRTVNSMATMVTNEQKGVLGRETVATACLTVLNRAGGDFSTANASSGQVYAFVIECVLSLPSSTLEAYGQNAALDLMQKFHDSNNHKQTQNLVTSLAQSLEKRDIFKKLEQATEWELASDGSNFVTQLFAIGQTCYLVDLAIKAEATDNEECRGYLSSFVGDDSLWNSSDPATRRFEEQRNALAKRYREIWDSNRVVRRHQYLRTLYNSLPSAGGEQSTLPKIDIQQSSGR
ncbi:unnamed protein product [Rhizoctonia solani]|uniref:DUF6535 domain-containing protein n=1 Tax=Rhizoctonia solani TaxID=456999 RepID=A0A8H3GVB2_9AGAM|nr:unnamed protein product [Rhizoctonia solani]